MQRPLSLSRPTARAMLAPPNPWKMSGAPPLGPGTLSPDQPFGALTLPVALTDSLRLSPEQFEQLFQTNPEAVLELAADGHLIVMTPTGGETSSRNSRLLIQLAIALSRCDTSLRIFDSSGGFRLPDGSVRSPDVSLVLEDRWQALSPE